MFFIVARVTVGAARPVVTVQYAEQGRWFVVLFTVYYLVPTVFLSVSAGSDVVASSLFPGLKTNGWSRNPNTSSSTSSSIRKILSTSSSTSSSHTIGPRNLTQISGTDGVRREGYWIYSGQNPPRTRPPCPPSRRFSAARRRTRILLRPTKNLLDDLHVGDEVRHHHFGQNPPQDTSAMSTIQKIFGGTKKDKVPLNISPGVRRTCPQIPHVHGSAPRPSFFTIVHDGVS